MLCWWWHCHHQQSMIQPYLSSTDATGSVHPMPPIIHGGPTYTTLLAQTSIGDTQKLATPLVWIDRPRIVPPSTSQSPSGVTQ